MGGMAYGPLGSTRHMTLGHEPASKIAGVAGAPCPRFDDRVAITEWAAPAETIDYGSTCARPIIHRFAITEVHDAGQLALSPGSAAKAVVTFGD